MEVEQPQAARFPQADLGSAPPNHIRGSGVMRQSDARLPNFRLAHNPTTTQSFFLCVFVAAVMEDSRKTAHVAVIESMRALILAVWTLRYPQ